MLNESRWVVATSWVCCGCYREGLILFAQLVVCGYRGFGSARVHWGLTYLPTTHICELRTFVAFKPQPSRVVQLTWWSMVGEGGSDGLWMRSNRPSKPGLNRTTMLMAPSIEQQLCRWFMISASYSCGQWSGGGRQPVWWVLIEQAARMRSMGSP